MTERGENIGAGADAAAAARFARLEALLDAALDGPDAEREALLRKCCGDDAALLHEALDMLHAMHDSTGFLETPSQAEPQATPGRAGLQLGPWRLQRRIGRGGMGEVWLATRDDGRFEQQVAVKLLRHWSEEDVPRFVREQRLLARLEHPGIARLLDAGSTPDGVPYMVMEYIEGRSITEHSRELDLSLHARLDLFVQVCDAVAYAHRHLVVHRDLKPQNILVRTDGRVALLDFGIARLLDHDAGTRTETHDLRLTPQYAAPEQLAGGAQTTLTDVYALGLLLHELLAGRPPWGVLGGHGPMAILQRALAGPPPPPSSVARRPADARALRGDLDAIVRKALRPEPDARYASVEALCDDVAAHRTLRPVRARGDAFGYRMRRGLRRYWLAASVSFLVVAGLLGGIAAIALAHRETARERDIAQTEAARSKAVRDYLAHMFRDAGQHARDGVALTAKQVLEQAAARVDAGFAADPGAAADMLKALGELHFHINDYAGAEPLLRRWLTHETAIDDPVAAADVRFTLAESLHRMGQSEEATQLLTSAQAFWSGAPERHADVLLASRMLQSQLERQRGEAERGIETLERSLPERLKHSGPVHFETATLYSNLGAAYVQGGRLDEGIAASQHAMELWRSLRLDTSNDALNTMNNLAAAQFRKGDLAGAETQFAAALAIRRAGHGPSGATAALIGNYARVLQRREKFDVALPLVEEAESMANTHAGPGSQLTLSMRVTRAELLLALQRPRDAAQVLDRLDGPDAAPLPDALSLRTGLARATQLHQAEQRDAAIETLQRVRTLADTMGAGAEPLRPQLVQLEEALGLIDTPQGEPAPN